MRRFYFLVIPIIPCLLMTSCAKETAPALPVVFTSQVSSITSNTANGGGELHSLWVTSFGVCWSLFQNPTIAGSHATGELKEGKFSCQLPGLNPETRYFVKAYATNVAGMTYGEELMFTTLPSGQLPNVTTVAVTQISTTAATCGGNVLNQGSSPVTNRGVCYGTSQSPTILDLQTSDGMGSGIFTSSLIALTPNTIYFARAFATNNSGTIYGSQEQFTTAAETGDPTVITDDAVLITQTSATAGGNVTLQGSTSVTARGVCWSTSKNPTTSDSHTTDGTGIGVYSSSLTGLIPGTLYYLRAYATNSSATAYGEQKNFTTLGSASGVPCPGMPSITDIRDGKVYPTVQIGTQCWLQKNLNVGARIEGTQIQNPAVLEKYCFNNMDGNCENYGGLYQWDEMMQGAVSPGVQGICMTGWHVPTDEEWTVLTTFLGGQIVAGGKLKETGTKYWLAPNTAATNESGFTAVPGGMGYLSTFGFLTINSLFWSSTQNSSATSWDRILYSDDSSMGRRGDEDKSFSKSVRCIRN